MTDPNTGDLIVAADKVITEEIGEAIEKAGIDVVEVRSPLTCESKSGICSSCYGRNLATVKGFRKVKRLEWLRHSRLVNRVLS